MATFRQTAYVAFLVSLVRGNIDTDGPFTIGDMAPFRPSRQLVQTFFTSQCHWFLQDSNVKYSYPKEPLKFDGKLWTVEISLQADIPLNGSTDKNFGVTEKGSSLNEAGNLTSDSTMCGHIMFSLRPNMTAANQDDAGKGGNCSFLCQQCQKYLQDSVKNGSSDCNSIIVPNSYEEWLDPLLPVDGASQMHSTLFELLTDSRFLKMGLEPMSSDNETEYDAAIRNIWPVLFTWSHVSKAINVTDAALRCLRPSNVASGSRDPDTSNMTGNGDSGNGDHPGAAGTYSVPNLGLKKSDERAAIA
ncbi:hypothetical protein MKX08_005917 [Trichoderma sp. CBMAI-0020]|nr:hypothetical protein MKX08_005917 [Trichoderma sp. CBMAI-0020]